MTETAETVTQAFELHRTEHPIRAPDLSKMESEDELTQIAVVDLPAGPFVNCVTGTLPTHFGHKQAEATKYLWVVSQDAVPIALESGDEGKATQRGRLSHTSLTGGEDAHTAGELWFVAPNAVVINGGSSRYTPRTTAELDSVARALRMAGYRVANMGYDYETGRFRRFVRGDLQWA